MQNKVLIVTGGASVGGSMVGAGDGSLTSAVRRQLDILKSSSGIWLDLSLKAVSAELLTAKAVYTRSRAYANSHYRSAVERYFSALSYVSSPELTEVVLAGLLEEEGLDFETTTFSELTHPKHKEAML